MKAIILALALIGPHAMALDYFESRPGNTITNQAATQRMIKLEQTYRCRQVRIGPNINAVKVPGSKDTFHSAIPQNGMDGMAAMETMASGKTVFECRSVGLNANGRVSVQ